MLEQIIAKGNRGHHSVENNTIRCADGFELSVVAGGGTYCTPRPAYCSCAWGRTDAPTALRGEAAHDFPGPYTAVEVMLLDGDAPDDWAEYESGGIYAFIPVDLVRAAVAAHGGEVL